VQEVGTLSQTIANWAEGNYKLSFEAAQRSDVVSNENFEVLVDGAIVGTFDPSGTSYQTFTTSSFTLASGSHTISFVGLNSAGGDNSVLLDNVTTASTLTPISPISPALPTIGDAGFENQSVGAGQFLYGPTGSSWTFAGTAGLSGNGSAFTAGIPAAPQGSQVAFLQEYGTISQSVANWTAGTYTLSFDAVQRADYGTSVENFEVLIDGAVVATIEPSSTAYQIYSTASFTVGAGSHTISFVGLDSAGGDNTVFLDQIAISATPALPTIDDSGFENQSVGAGQFLYEPTGSSWTFAGTAGLSGNGSGFTAGNPAAPQGSQVAVLQQYGTITQSVADWTAGTYTLSFDVAQRANYGTSVENFEVLIDGVVVGTYQPTSTSYQTFVTSSFTVASGTHTISFVGLDSSGGDNTVLIDDVTLS
jgi:hypothetical protein